MKSLMVIITDVSVATFLNTSKKDHTIITHEIGEGVETLLRALNHPLFRGSLPYKIYDTRSKVAPV